MHSVTSSFAFEPSASPVADEDRAQRLIDPGFGKVFTDHMAIVRYSEAKGWHDARITARQPVPMDPAAAVLHYAQEIFEGMKAYHRPGGGAALFRPEANARRFNASARRMAMAELPEAIFLELGAGAGPRRQGVDPGRAGRRALSAPLHVRERGLPRREARDRISLHRDGRCPSAPISAATRPRSRSGRRATISAPRRAGPARPNAAAIMPRA